MPHHQQWRSEVTELDADLDSPAFANWWGGIPEGTAPGVVVNLFVDARQEVDELHRRALDLGATGLKAPWDAFWGARYAVFAAPGSLCVGVMSEPDEAVRTMPPAIEEFAPPG